MRRKIPAVTRVDEWTSAETGVGAAMAAGSHLEKGIWALFVIAARRIARVLRSVRWEGERFRVCQCPWLIVSPMAIRIMASPIRLVRAVIILAARDLGF